MVGLIEGGAYEVGHAGIDDGKLLGGPLLHVEGAGDERAHLAHDGAAQFEVQPLPLAELQVARVGVEVGLEVGHGHAVGVVVVDAQSAAHVEVFQPYVAVLQVGLQVVDAVAQGLEVAHVEYLAADVEVQSDERHVLQRRGLLDDAVHVFQGDAELVFGQPRGDVGMGVGPDVGVDAEGHAGRGALAGRQFVDDFQFGNALHVEAEDVLVQREVDFPVALAHACKHRLRRRESGPQGGLYFAAAHAVGTQPGLAYHVEHLGVGVGLHGIVYHKPVVACGLVVDTLERASQQLRVIVVEGGSCVPEFVGREDSFRHSMF